MTRPLLLAAALVVFVEAAAGPGAASGPRPTESAPVPRLTVRAALLGIGAEVHAGYVRVSEVLHLENTSTQAIAADVSIPFPSAARFLTFHEGLSQPRVEGDRIVDRLTLPPGLYRIVYAYTMGGAGEVALNRYLPMPIERVDVLTTAPAAIKSEGLTPLPPVTLGRRTFLRASGRISTPGTLALAVTGVPASRHWPAPVAAAFLAGLLLVGLGHAAARAGVASASWKRFQRSQ